MPFSVCSVCSVSKSFLLPFFVFFVFFVFQSLDPALIRQHLQRKGAPGFHDRSFQGA